MRVPKRGRVECSRLAVVLPFPVFPLFPMSVANDHTRSANDDPRSGGRCVALRPKYNNEIAQPISCPQLPHGASRRSARNSPGLSGSHAPLTFLSRKLAGNWPTGGRDRHLTRRVVTLRSFEQVLQFLVLPFPLGEYDFRYNSTEGLAVVGLDSFHIARLFFRAETVGWRRR